MGILMKDEDCIWSAGALFYNLGHSFLFIPHAFTHSFTEPSRPKAVMPPSSLPEPLLWAITKHWLCLTLTPRAQALLNSLQMTQSQNISPTLAIILSSSFHPPLLPRQGKPEEREDYAAVFWSVFISCYGCMGVGEGKRGGEGERNCGCFLLSCSVVPHRKTWLWIVLCDSHPLLQKYVLQSHLEGSSQKFAKYMTKEFSGKRGFLLH